MAGLDRLGTGTYLIASQPLGPIHSLVSLLHEFAGGDAIQEIDGDANTIVMLMPLSMWGKASG